LKKSASLNPAKMCAAVKNIFTDKMISVNLMEKL